MSIMGKKLNLKKIKILRQQRVTDETTLRELNSDMEKPFSGRVDFLLGEDF